MAGEHEGLMAALGGSTLLGVVFLFLWLCHRSYGTHWRPVGTLSSIWIYPLKSAAPTAVTSAFCNNLGLHHRTLSDRMFVVYEETTGSVVTSRTDPKLLRIKVDSTSRGSVVFSSSSGREELEIDLASIAESTRPIRMKFPTTDTESLDTLDCGDPPASWVSAELDRLGVRLGYWPAAFSRDICKPRHRELQVFKQINNKIAGAYSNMSSYLLINTSSVDDLLVRLGPGSTVGPENFRGNILVTGAKAYAEDDWSMLKIGETYFRIVKPCVRCILVTVDPKSLERDPHMEPLRTLKTYRQLTDTKERNIEGDSPVMGCYMGLDTPGEIRVGDTVYALTSQPKSKIVKMIHYLRFVFNEV